MATYFGSSKSPFRPSGTYITKQGGVSYQSPSDKSKSTQKITSYSRGGGSRSRNKSTSSSSVESLPQSRPQQDPAQLAQATTSAGELAQKKITEQQFNLRMQQAGVVSAQGRMITSAEVRKTGGGYYDETSGRFIPRQEATRQAKESARQEQILKTKQQFETAQTSPFQDKQTKLLSTTQAIKNLESQQKSVQTPPKESLERLRQQETTGFFKGEIFTRPVESAIYAEFEKGAITSTEAELAYEKGLRETAKKDAEAFKQQQEPIISNKIEELRASNDYLAKINELQGRADSGEDVDKLNKELEEYDKKNVIDVVNKEYESSFNSWFGEYSKSKQLEATEFMAKYGKTTTREKFGKLIKKGAKEGAVIGGGLAVITGGLKLGGKGAVAGVIGTGATILGGLAIAGAVGVGGYQYYKNKNELKAMGFSDKQASEISTRYVTGMATDLAVEAVGFGIGAGITSTIIGAGVNKLQAVKINSQIAKFRKEMITNPKVTQKVFTKANMERGYIIKKFDGVSVKISTTETQYNNILAYRQGKPDQVFRGGGVDSKKQAGIINQLTKKGIKVDETFELSEVYARNIARLTKQPIGRLNKYYIVVKNGQGFRFKLTKSGKITNFERIKVLKTSQGESIIHTQKIGTQSSPISEGLFSFRAKTPKVTNKFYAQQSKLTKVKRAGDIKYEEGLFRTYELKGVKGDERLFQYKKSSLVGEGTTKRVSVSKESFFSRGNNVGKARVEKGLFEVTGKSAREPPIFEIGKTPKPPRPLKDMVASPTGKEPSVFGEGKGELLQTQKTEPSLLGDTIPTSLSRRVSLPKAPKVKTAPPRPEIMVFGDFLKGSEEYQKAGSILGGLESGRRIDTRGGQIRIRKLDRKVTPPLFGSRIKPYSSSNMIQQQTIEQTPILTPEITPQIVPILQPRPKPPIQQTWEPFGFLGFGIGLGDINVGGGEKGRKPKKKTKGKVAYTPSLGSILLRRPKVKVTRKQAIALGKIEYTGLEVRPEIEIKTNKKSGLGFF